jgi:hypothetical protein
MGTQQWCPRIVPPHSIVAMVLPNLLTMVRVSDVSTVVVYVSLSDDNIIELYKSAYIRVDQQESRLARVSIHLYIYNYKYQNRKVCCSSKGGSAPLPNNQLVCIYA